jgi:hypothetical protein
MTPADRRITELIQKWLTSIELHLEYVELSDAAYARAQSWPKHDRPTRWVLEVARQKLLELKSHCETRQAMGDGRFSESLELMAFLANLVGIQHIERFVPLADPSYTAPTGATAAVEAPAIARPQAPKPRPASDEATREMPRIKTPAPAVRAPAPAARAVAPPTRAAAPAAAPARSDGKPAARASGAARPTPTAAKASPKAAAPTDLRGKIIADAIRLLKWGKPWHELAELIARIAERPPEADIRKVLRAHKSEIEAKAAEDS